MAKITFIEHGGKKTEFDVDNGVSVMQGAVDNMIDGIVAECGGGCACATCHCYVDDAWLARVGMPTEMEQDMLEAVLEPKPNSRLSCQITVSDELDGLVVHVPESQY